MVYKTKAYSVFTVFNLVFMALFCIVITFPYLNVLAKSLNDAKDTALGGLSFYPRKPTFENYRLLFSDPGLLRAGWVSVARVVLGILLALAVQFTAAYAFSQRRLVGKKVLLLYLVIPMFFNGGLIPTYILLSQLRLLNSFLVYLLPSAFSLFNMVVIRTYLYTISESLTEVAKLEGAGHFKILWYIMVPMSKPIIANSVSSPPFTRPLCGSVWPT